MPSLNWSSGSCSHIGNVRERNEDACLNRPDVGLWAVADGMGGHLHGDVASNKAIEAIDLHSGDASLDERIDEIAYALDSVNQELIEFVDDENEVCGCTIAILLIEQGETVCLWAGDSRVYQYRGGKLEQLTVDHVESNEEDLPDGCANEAEMFLARAVGKDDELVIDLCTIEPQDGDRYLICTDGLYGELSDDSIEMILAGAAAAKLAARRLVEAALDCACYDNVTAVVVDFEAWSE